MYVLLTNSEQGEAGEVAAVRQSDSQPQVTFNAINASGDVIQGSNITVNKVNKTYYSGRLRSSVPARKRRERGKHAASLATIECSVYIRRTREQRRQG